ncbi:MAG: septum formation family protein [Acidimicrobiia bacterium]
MPTPPIVAGQVPAKRRGCSTGCLIIGVVVMAVLAIGAFIVWRYIESNILPTIQGVEEVVDEFGSIALVPGPPGPCYDLEVEDGLVTGWAEVSCDGPRDVEAFFWAEFNDEPFPGDEYIADAAADTCAEAFEVYVGTTVGQSQYDLDWIVPSEATWAEGDREAVCLVVSGTGSPLTGTVKGSAA